MAAQEEENPFLEWIERRKWPVFLGATTIASVVAWFMKRRWLALGITVGSFLVIGLAFLAFPLTVWLIHGWVVGAVSQLGLNPYLAEAVALATAVGLYFVFSTFVFDFDSRKHKIGMALVWSLAIGFFLAMYLKTRDTPYVMENGKAKAIGGVTVDPAMGTLREHETIGMVTEDGSISRPVTSIDSVVVKQQIELRYYLVEHNEFKPYFLLDPENLKKVPWVHYETGEFLCSYCAGLDGEVRLYLGPGRCNDGKPREPANGTIQEMLERRARKHQETLKVEQWKKQEEERKKTEREAEEERRRVEAESLKQQLTAMNAKEQEFTQQIVSLQSMVGALSERMEKMHALPSQSDEEDVSSPSSPPVPPSTPVVSEREGVTFAAATTTYPSPKPRADLVIREELWFEREVRSLFARFTLQERNGADVAFNKYTISIWHLAGLGESVASAKQRVAKRNQQLRDLGKETDNSGHDATHTFTSPNIIFEVRSKQSVAGRLSLHSYRSWFGSYNWVELTFSGTDTSGNAQEITLAGSACFGSWC